LMVPRYVLFKHFGWVGSPKPLWVPERFGSAFNIFLLRQFFISIPFELAHSAKLDGPSEFGIYRHVILPPANPALAVAALVNFMFVWNDFMGPLIYLTDQKSYTLAYGLQAYQSQHGGTQWHLLMAAATIVVAPVIVVFFLAQRTFIQGITVTGIKGWFAGRSDTLIEMKALFDDPLFDGQFLRILGHIYYGGADIGECILTARRITPGDFDSWHREWVATAERIYEA